MSGSMGATGIQLAAQLPVMAMGGFSGGDPVPTPGRLQLEIAAGNLRCVLLGGGPGRGGFGGFGGAPGRRRPTERTGAA